MGPPHVPFHYGFKNIAYQAGHHERKQHSLQIAYKPQHGQHYRYRKENAYRTIERKGPARVSRTLVLSRFCYFVLVHIVCFIESRLPVQSAILNFFNYLY